jgi:CRISPR system Cascade subunit CasD
VTIFTIRFKGPLMALQGPRIDARPQGLAIPTRSLVTGLIGAALGLDRSEGALLQKVQDTMRLAVLVQREGQEVIDYQIADLSKAHMIGPMWTSGVSIVKREGSQIDGLRQQWRPYLADADMLLLVELLPGAPFSATQILEALDQPQRPLFLGRTSCPPETRLAGEILPTASLTDTAAMLSRENSDIVYLPAECTTPQWGDLPISIPGRRDWLANRHSGADLYLARPGAVMERPA